VKEPVDKPGAVEKVIERVAIFVLTPWKLMAEQAYILPPLPLPP
jgi:hypothetical protein